MTPHRVRCRRVVTGSGQVEESRSVFCESHAEAVPLAECEVCERCEGVALGERGDVVTLSCRPDPEATPCDNPQRPLLPANAARTYLSEVMSPDIICVTDDVCAETLTALFLDNAISALPVVNERGWPIGLVTKTDLLRHRRAVESNAPARDLMVPYAFALREDERLSRAAELMATELLHHLPVVSADNRVVGILSSQDIVSWVAREGSL
jgi:CBS domain-containing protein